MSSLRRGGFEAEGLTATFIILGSGAGSQQLRPKMCGHLHLHVCLVFVLAYGAVARTWPRSVGEWNTKCERTNGRVPWMETGCRRLRCTVCVCFPWSVESTWHSSRGYSADCAHVQNM